VVNLPYLKPKYDPIKDEFTCEFPIFEDKTTYYVCNKVCQDLARHITRHHGILVDEYRKMLGIDKNEKLISERTKEKLRKNPVLIAISHKNLTPIAAGFQKGDNTRQSYERSPQTRSRLRRLHLFRKPTPIGTKYISKSVRWKIRKLQIAKEKELKKLKTKL
jgi:hypothetical protein